MCFSTEPKQVYHFSSLSVFVYYVKASADEQLARLIVLHSKQNIESELKWQTC